jgi:hypothetical protein
MTTAPKKRTFKCWVAFDGRGRINAVLFRVTKEAEMRKLGWEPATLTLSTKPGKKK